MTFGYGYRVAKLSMALLIVGACLSSPSVFAYPGVLANTPLTVSATSQPNIMLLIDDSGSMANIVADSPFDGTTMGNVCPAANRLSTTGTAITLKVTGLGIPYFSYGASNYDWGNSGSAVLPGLTLHPTRCFDPSLTYTNVQLNTAAGSGSPTDYRGNYLNWYFGSAPTIWPIGSNWRPGTNTRITIAKAAAQGLVNSLSNVRIGLATYSSSGANILVGVNSISTNAAAMSTKLSGLTASGMTPLATALRDIGRYFVQGYNNNLTIHSGLSNQATVAAYTLFDQTPSYASGVVQSSPIQYYCQKNFTIIMTDGRPNGDRSINAYLADYDGDCASAVPACLAYEQKVGRTYEASGSDYLDDVAAALYDVDLRPDLTDAGGNPIKKNMITYTVGFADTTVQNDPLMQETANNGHGLFVSAGNTAALVDAFESITQNIISQLGAVGRVAFNSGSLASGSAVFLTEFNTTRWDGNLIRYPVSTTGTLGAANWTAASVLAATSPSSRVILTYNRDLSRGVAFDALTNLSAAAVADLEYNDATLALDRLNYIRGDRTQEGAASTDQFRVRTSVLGDIAHSSPVYVGEPSAPWPDSAPFPTTSGQKYSDYKTGSAKTRIPMIYAGSNDGMMHGFRADNATTGGSELIAYIPHRLYSSAPGAGLHYLTDSAYTHLFYVDQTPTINDAYIKTSASGSPSWRTIMVGALGAGGRGLFALDVTDPSSFSQANASNLVLWEFTDQDNVDLGYTLSQPTIAFLPNGRWAAIFGNGYNSNGSGEAKLFIVYLDAGFTGNWTQGTDYVVINTKVGNTTTPNGLSTPAVVDINKDGVAERVYAGDLYGNLWVFDLSNPTASNWKTAYGTPAAPSPLFTARSSGGAVQPITAKPLLAVNPDVSTGVANQPNYLVLFGTGQYLTSADVTDTTAQTMYGVWDSGIGSLTRSKLVAQTYTAAGANNRTLTNNAVPYSATGASQRFGWMIDFTGGERIIDPVKVRNRAVFFNTAYPDSLPCGTGGTGWLMTANLDNGGNPGIVLFDTNNDGLVNNNDKISGAVVAGQRFTTGLPSESVFRNNIQFTLSSSAQLNARVLSQTLAPRTGRSAWQELRNEKPH